MFKRALQLALTVLAIALTYVILVDIRPLIHAWGQVPVSLTAQVSRVLDGDPDSVNVTNRKSLRTFLAGELNNQTRKLTQTAQTEIHNGLDKIDSRLGQTLTVLDHRTGELTATVAGVREDIKPAITGTTSLLGEATVTVKDAHDSWDDLYPDIKSTVESATVTTTSVAYASEAVRDAAPKIAKSVIGIGTSSDGIAADIHTATTDFVKPRTFWQKVRLWGETTGKLIARIL